MGIDKILSAIDLAGSAEKLNKYRAVVEKTVPKELNAGGRYWAMYIQMIQKFISDPKVTKKETILPCLYNAAKLGLIPDPVMGQIYFIPYSGELTYQIGYKGMVALSYRSGKIKNIRAGQVFEKDEWTFHEDENGQHYHFEPALSLSERERGRELFVYSIFTDTDGINFVHIMPSSHVDEIKKIVKARMKGASTPWDNATYEPEMRKKTCIRQQWKTQVFSVEIARAIEHEEADERGDHIKEVHPELEGIIDDIMDKSTDTKEENQTALPFGEKKPMEMGD